MSTRRIHSDDILVSRAKALLRKHGGPDPDAQAAEIERLTRERDEAQHHFDEAVLIAEREKASATAEIERLTRQLDAARQVERNVQKAREAEFARATAAKAERDALRVALVDLIEAAESGWKPSEDWGALNRARVAIGGKP